ncbi:MAG: GTPase [Planctomycetales bacterium 4484_113]|nr:MAG: GTPase [Planctomycetales bacterium 4484_113]
MARKRVVLIGAAGRDFHDFNTVFRENEEFDVVAFTATQIPDIEGRVYPPSLAGKLYPRGIPIEPMDDLEKLIAELEVDVCYFCYSDISYQDVMSVGARVLSAGAEFAFLGPFETMLPASKPVIAVVAARTGCGKSQTARFLTRELNEMGQRVAVVRHPMPYGNLEAQRVQKFETIEDLSRQHCTIEEMEEYEPHITAGNVVFAGVDYAEVLAAAEEAADVVLWDGGNNDTCFFRPRLTITLTDPHRAGHELSYYPGELNLRFADVVLINKVDTGDSQQIAAMERNVRSVNPRAQILHARSPVVAEHPELIQGRRVLAVEDGPTVTHGGMSFGAAYIAATEHQAAEIIDPRQYATGSIQDAYRKYPHLKNVLPALGYSEAQLTELAETIARVPCDAVLVGTPIDLSRVIGIQQPTVRVQYSLEEVKPGALRSVLEQTLLSG